MTVPACRVKMAEPVKMASTRSPVVVRLATMGSIVKVRVVHTCRGVGRKIHRAGIQGPTANFDIGEGATLNFWSFQ